MLPPFDRRQFLKTLGGGSLLLLTPTLLQTRPTKPTSKPASGKQAEAIAKISVLAAGSAIASYQWKDRGRAPAGYIKGMAVSYAKLSYALSVGDPYAVEMAKAMGEDEAKDALKHYEEVFKAAEMDNAKAGQDTLRHLLVLMMGLGMRESSGKYCEGRDKSADNTTAETAEAGLFQTSFNARKASPLLPKLFKDFNANPTPTYLEVFREGVKAKEAELENFGSGEGRDFQKLSKEAPFFALSFAAIGLRNIRKHWGPINRRAAEIKTEADTLFKDVQTLIDTDKLGPAL